MNWLHIREETSLLDEQLLAACLLLLWTDNTKFQVSEMKDVDGQPQPNPYLFTSHMLSKEQAKT
jgi:hypothetical protein